MTAWLYNIVTCTAKVEVEVVKVKLELFSSFLAADMFIHGLSSESERKGRSRAMNHSSRTLQCNPMMDDSLLLFFSLQ
jgi:hypothetical protein